MPRTTKFGILAALAMLLALSAGPAAADNRPDTVQLFVDVSAAPAFGQGCGMQVAVRLQTAVGPAARAQVDIEVRDGVTVVGRVTRLASIDGEAFAWVPSSPAARPRLTLSVGGEPIEAWDLAVVEGSCAGAPIDEWLSRRVAWSVLAPPAVRPSASTLAPFPTHGQQRNLSCEFASVQIVTTYFGATVSEFDVERLVGYSPNPHKGFRGNIEGWWGNTVDYGVYPEALAPAMPAFGYRAEVLYAEGNPDALTFRLDAGIPVIVWVALQGDRRETIEVDGAKVTLNAGIHVMVAWAYDENGVYLSDPATRAYDFFPWPVFMDRWAILDGMALAVIPA
jgi:predicted double-glycine peptidase